MPDQFTAQFQSCLSGYDPNDFPIWLQSFPAQSSSHYSNIKTGIYQRCFDAPWCEVLEPVSDLPCFLRLDNKITIQGQALIRVNK